MRVSAETKASINSSEMDAQLDSLRRNFAPVRISTSDRTQARFISMSPLDHKTFTISDVSFVVAVGSHNSLLDTACEMLSPDLRPIPPQPNCPQSMQIYEDHRKVSLLSPNVIFDCLVGCSLLLSLWGCRERWRS